MARLARGALAAARRAVGRVLRVTGLRPPGPEASAGYEVVDGPPSRLVEEAWRSPRVAARQHGAYEALLAEMRAGRPRRDLAAAAEAVRRTGIRRPTILEVGCGSGYYSEVLAHLVEHDIEYTGVDASRSMVELARERYPRHRFLVGDGARLALSTGAVDIVLNGAALMHMRDYPAAIAESARVARHWCIFHTVPVLQDRPTTWLRKRAYGDWAHEVVFNEAELLARLRAGGLEPVSVLPSLDYDLAAVLGERTCSRTYVCRKLAA